MKPVGGETFLNSGSGKRDGTVPETNMFCKTCLNSDSMKDFQSRSGKQIFDSQTSFKHADLCADENPPVVGSKKSFQVLKHNGCHQKQVCDLFQGYAVYTCVFLSARHKYVCVYIR